MEQMKLQELIDQVLAKLTELNYSVHTIRNHRCVYRFLSEYAETIPTDEFTEDLGLEFLENFSTFRYRREDKKESTLKSRGEVGATAIRKLAEFKRFGTFSRKPRSMQIQDWALDDYQIMLSYGHSCEPIDTGKTTMNDRLKQLRHFYLYLESKGLTSVKQASPQIFSDYVLSMAGFSKVTIKHKRKQLRQYLRFLYHDGYLREDYSFLIPRSTAVKNAALPMIWDTDDVEKLLGSIDQSSPVGKRNYAVILLFAELGLRAGDVNSLKLSDIDWDKKEINIVQEKTGVLNVCPLTDRAGWAIINYIRYGRPKSDLPFVFLTCNAPYTGFGATTAVTMLKSQMRHAGIKPSHEGAKTGVHSLRHSLARRLLDNDVPLEDIADIMGHTEVVSSSPYLKIDVEGLRRCALSLKEVSRYV